MKPRWREIESENSWLSTEYFDYDGSPEKVKEYGIGKSLPIFIFLDKEGKEFLRLSGEVSKEELLKVISENKDR